ncbi:MAG: NTP transferase domain-containing protein [Acidimicrobiales bacterium]
MTAPVVVLAGGLGTRVAELTGDALPKALLDVAGRPFLERKFDELIGHGVTEVFLLIGHRASAIAAYLERQPPTRLQAHCVFDGNRLLGTGGAVRNALDVLPDAFWVTYGDTILDAPMEEIEQAWRNSGRQSLMTVLHNRDEEQRSNTSIADGLVTAYSKHDPPGTHEYIDYGLLLFAKQAFAEFDAGMAFDLAEVISAQVARSQMAAAIVSSWFHDIGTPGALARTSELFSGLVAAPPTPE